MSLVIEKQICKSIDVHTSEKSCIDEEVMMLLQKGNPIEYIMGQFSKIHVGDRNLGELLLMTIGCQLGSNTEGLQPDLSGESGKGKSDACKAMLHLLPQEYVIRGSNSTMALFHREDISKGAVVFLDDVERFNEKEEQFIKTITSQYQLPYEHTYTNMGKKEAKKADTLVVPERLIFWITSVSSSFDPQILNRYLKMQVDEGEAQDMAVFQQQREYAKSGIARFAITPEIEVARHMLRHLKQLPLCKVSIPYIDLIDWKGRENRRNYPMFLDIIRASAALNRYQRDPTTDGTIVANIDDYDRAVRLWSNIERAQTTGFTNKEQLVLSAIVASGSAGLTQSEIAAKCSIDKSAVSKAIHGISQGNGTHKGGLMNKLKGDLLYNTFHRRYTCTGLSSTTENIVSLSSREEATAMINSYTKLHAVATQMQPILST